MTSRRSFLAGLVAAAAAPEVACAAAAPAAPKPVILDWGHVPAKFGIHSVFFTAGAVYVDNVQFVEPYPLSIIDSLPGARGRA